MALVKQGRDDVAAEVMLHVQPQPKISDCGFNVIVHIYELQAAHTWAPSNHLDNVLIEHILRIAICSDVVGRRRLIRLR